MFFFSGVFPPEARLLRKYARTTFLLARPQFKPTSKQRRQVSVAAGGGMSHEEIALGLGISRNTLEKHFELELSTMAYQRRLEALDALHRAAKKGNVAAIKAYTAMTPRAAAPPAEVPKPVATKAEGKKAQQQARARIAQAGTEWEEILPPPSSSLQ
jgi:hypothetical protein